MFSKEKITIYRDLNVINNTISKINQGLLIKQIKNMIIIFMITRQIAIESKRSITSLTLLEKYPNEEFFLVRNFLYLD